VAISLAAGPKTIRQVDFKNFSYPWRDPPDWPDHLTWQNMSERDHVQLTKGLCTLDTEAEKEGRPFSGLTFEEAQYADVTGDGQIDAIVLLRYDTGGTQYYYYVYIYRFAAGKPKLLAYFQSGDRAHSGLYRVYGEGGKLVVELFDPKKESGDCCSTGFVRTRYQWRNGKFEAVGAQEFGTPQAPSRLRVSVFGTHY
jgi:hypothetical protein